MSDEESNGTNVLQSLRGAEIVVTDIPRAIIFYTEALGMKHISDDPRQALVSGNGFTILLKKRLDAGMETNIFFGVENVSELREHLLDIGITSVQIPVDGPMGRTLTFKDVDGNILHAIENTDNIE